MLLFVFWFSYAPLHTHTQSRAHNIREREVKAPPVAQKLIELQATLQRALDHKHSVLYFLVYAGNSAQKLDRKICVITFQK